MSFGIRPQSHSPPPPFVFAPREAIDSLLSARHSIAFRVDELRAQLEDLERRQAGEADRPE